MTVSIATAITDLNKAVLWKTTENLRYLHYWINVELKLKATIYTICPRAAEKLNRFFDFICPELELDFTNLVLVKMDAPDGANYLINYYPHRATNASVLAADNFFHDDPILKTINDFEQDIFQ